MDLKQLVNGLKEGSEYTTADGKTLTDIDNATIVGFIEESVTKTDKMGKKIIVNGKIKREVTKKYFEISMYNLNKASILNGIKLVTNKRVKADVPKIDDTEKEAVKPKEGKS